MDIPTAILSVLSYCSHKKDLKRKTTIYVLMGDFNINLLKFELHIPTDEFGVYWEFIVY